MAPEEHLYQGRLHSIKGEYKEAIGFITYMEGPLNKDKVASNKYMKLR